MTETPCYICLHVFENSRPVLLVSKEGGDWQFLCGGEHGQDELPRVVGINHLLSRDNTLLELLDLNDNWEAERKSLKDPWTRRKI